MTISPNRRHSALLLRLSRCRRGDPMLAHRDRDSADGSSALAYWRHRYASASEPKSFTQTSYVRDSTGAEVKREIELPDWQSARFASDHSVASSGTAQRCFGRCPDRLWHRALPRSISGTALLDCDLIGWIASSIVESYPLRAH